MTELLETSMATRRNKRVPATGADEALERFFKFRPPEFYGDIEQEIKVELFLEQLNDIYDTLKYEDILRENNHWFSGDSNINVLDKDHGNLEISRDPMVNKGLEMKADQPQSLEESTEYVHTVDEVGMWLKCVIGS
ncbi:hypothetical protein M9H77_03016 [Catharanthus roseus]|uniref:Uncharacterized protein n=1 Tax=Catharanthus roseus TaxID=4058 RepID=A0ACC0C9X9_CATRO|nr:hypothetical protein M9H77_03016 [Catharanthus roseus]